MKIKKLMVLTLASFIIVPSFAVPTIYRCPNKQDMIRNGQWFCPVGWNCSFAPVPPPPLDNFQWNRAFLNNQYLTREGLCIYSYVRANDLATAKQATTRGGYSGVNPSNWRGAGGNTLICIKNNIDACKFKLQ